MEPHLLRSAGRRHGVEGALTEARIAASMGSGLDWAAAGGLPARRMGCFSTWQTRRRRHRRQQRRSPPPAPAGSAKLTGQQFGAFHRALLNAFSLDELRMMVRIELGENLDTIASTGSLSAITEALISWAERTGLLAALVQGASKTRPGNQNRRPHIALWQTPLTPLSSIAKWQRPHVAEMPDHRTLYALYNCCLTNLN